MKTKKFLKNTRFALLLQIITVVFGFLIPRFVIFTYGSEINGLTTTINQVINTLNLLQAGAVGATVYRLYKHIQDNNFDEISNSLRDTRRYFTKIGIAFIIISLLIVPIIALNLDTDIKLQLVLLSFFIMVIKGSLDFFFTSQYKSIFIADQKGYIISIGMIIELIIYYSGVFLSISLLLPFYFMYIFLLAAVIVKIVLLRVIFIKAYPYISQRQNTTHNYRPDRNRIYVTLNEISYNIILSIPPIILSLSYGLIEASIYAIYNMVLTILLVFTNSIYNSFIPSFGNIIAEKRSDEARYVFDLFQFILMNISIFIYSVALILIKPFVGIYTQGVTDVDYSNNLYGIFFILFGIMNVIRVPQNIYISANGMFKQTYLQVSISSVICMFISMFLSKIRPEFVLLGPIFFYFGVFIFQTKLISIHDKSYNLSLSIKLLITQIIFTISTIVIVFLDFIIVSSILNWIKTAFLVSFIIGCFLIVINLVIFNKNVKDLIRYIKQFFKKNKGGI